MNEVEALTIRVAQLESQLALFMKLDRFQFTRNVELPNGVNFVFGGGSGTDRVGTRIGTNALQKMSVYGVTPIVQGAAITAPTGGATVDSPARTAINSIRAALTAFGITA